MEIYFKYLHKENSVGKNAPAEPGKQENNNNNKNRVSPEKQGGR